MAHGPLPPTPILVLPSAVASELLALGLADTSRNPMGEFSAGTWWQGLLIFSGDASSAISLIQGIAAIPKLAKILHTWNQIPSNKSSTDKIESKQRVLRYQSSKGQAVLELSDEPTLKDLTDWLTVAYAILETESESRD